MDYKLIKSGTLKMEHLGISLNDGINQQGISGHKQSTKLKTEKMGVLRKMLRSKFLDKLWNYIKIKKLKLDVLTKWFKNEEWDYNKKKYLKCCITYIDTNEY